MGEDVLLAIYPEIRETFLSGVKNLSEVAKTSFFVENFVSFAKLLAIGPRSAVGFEYFAQSLNLVQEPFACALPVL